MCAVLVLSACSSTSGSDTDTNSSTEPSVDLASLDTGEYATEPHGPFGKADESNGAAFESQRMAEYMALPFEIDPAFTERTTLPLQSIRIASENRPLSDDEQKVIDTNGFLYGVASGGDVPTSDGPVERKMMYQVLRFPTPDNARDAAAQLADIALEHSEPVEVPGHPDAMSFSNNDRSADKVQVDSFQPHGEYLLLSQVRSPASDLGWSVEHTARFIDVQSPLIDGFYGVEASAAPRPADAPKVDTTLDQNDIIKYAVPRPEDDENGTGGSEIAAYGPRGYALMGDNAEQTLRQLDEADVKHIGYWGTSVFRAGSDDQAEELEKNFLKNDRDGGGKDADSPAGLPNATCTEEAISSGIVHACYVRVGRYVGLAQELDDVEAVHQKISAQYLILQQADQEYED